MSSTLKMPFLTLLFSLLFVDLSIAGYVLEDDYSPSNFFDMFTFFTGADPTNGFVDYVDQATAQSAGYISNTSTSIYIGTDSENVTPDGRPSVRLTSNKAYNAGSLVILDLEHMPGGICGTWPAFWMVGPDWPNGGEIDIIEGVNLQTDNLMTLHTSDGCSITNDGNFTGSLLTDNCYIDAADQSYNAGCSIDDDSSSSYGTGFNDILGGVYATEWTDESISIWFFPRGSIPSDITAGTPTPGDSWGTPAAQFQGGCDIPEFFQNNQIVFDLTFCGDWAGAVWDESTCSAYASTCDAYVADNPSAFADAYWTINSLQVFTYSADSSSSASTSSAVASSSVVASSAVASSSVAESSAVGTTASTAWWVEAQAATTTTSSEASSTEASSTEASSTEATSTEAYSTEASSTEAYSTPASSTEAASTEASSTEATSTEASSTEAASTQAEATSTSAAATATSEPDEAIVTVADGTVLTTYIAPATTTTTYAASSTTEAETTATSEASVSVAVVTVQGSTVWTTTTLGTTTTTYAASAAATTATSEASVSVDVVTVQGSTVWTTTTLGTTTTTYAADAITISLDDDEYAAAATTTTTTSTSETTSTTTTIESTLSTLSATTPWWVLAEATPTSVWEIAKRDEEKDTVAAQTTLQTVSQPKSSSRVELSGSEAVVNQRRGSSVELVGSDVVVNQRRHLVQHKKRFSGHY